jgi:hypothetical protein
MKIHLIAPALLIMSLVPALAADFTDMGGNPATISVTNGKMVPLVISTDKKGWSKIPPELTDCHATIFEPNKEGQGFIDFDVLEDGYVLLACNFDYQGNASGNWKEEAWSEEDFDSHGWYTVHKSDITGSLIQWDNREQTIFYKKVGKGDTYHIRCNKADPPYAILLQRAPTPPDEFHSNP